MKKFFVLFLLTTISLSVLPQGGHPWKGNNDFLYEYLKQYPDLEKGKIYYIIPVTFWTYGTPPVSYREIKAQIEALNYYFELNQTGIRFYLANVIRKKGRSHQIVNYYTEAPIISTVNKIKGTLNIHYVNILEKNFFGKRKVLSGVHNSANATIVLSRRSSPTSLAHEVGHFLGLLHPHKNWKKGKRKQECVSRTRTVHNKGKKRICEVNGDMLCDTPAEPNLLDCTDEDCNYICKLKDAWGDIYHPDIHNIMSYSNKQCRYKFTSMQKAVMLYKAEHNKYSQFWRLNASNIHYEFDKYEPDNFRTIATKLNKQKQYHTFHKTFESLKLKNKDNDKDCFVFSPDTASNYFLNIEKADNLFPTIKIIIYRQKIPIDTIQINKPGKINLKLQKKVYFFCLEKTSPLPDGKIADYYISISQK